MISHYRSHLPVWGYTHPSRHRHGCRRSPCTSKGPGSGQAPGHARGSDAAQGMQPQPPTAGGGPGAASDSQTAGRCARVGTTLRPLGAEGSAPTLTRRRRGSHVLCCCSSEEGQSTAIFQMQMITRNTQLQRCKPETLNSNQDRQLCPGAAGHTTTL